jgi:triacylglycerol esterase/lipase EstA (alpha/beta hydrolase family)
MRIPMKVRSRGVILATVATLSVLAAPPLSTAGAQPPATLDKNVAFLHGFGSNGSVWTQAMNTLRTNLRIKAIAPNTDWWERIPVQAGQLTPQLNTAFGADSTVKVKLVAHSQGGVVARSFARLSTRGDGLVTVGSPHQGAAIAANFYYGGVQNWVRWVASSIATPIQYYSAYDPAFRDPYFNGNARDLTFFQLLYSAIALIQSRFCTEMGFCEMLAGQLAPAILDEIPGSAFHQSLVQTQTTEQQRLAQRVSIRVTDSPYNVMWKLMFGGNNGAAAGALIRGYVWAQSVTEWLRYNNSPEYMLAAGSDLWLYTAQAVGDMDADWAALCGGLQGYYRPSPLIPEPWLITDFDGFISGASQVMTNGTRTIGVSNMYHTQETTQTTSSIETALTGSLGVSSRPVNSVAYVAVQPASATIGVGSTAQLSASTFSVKNAPLPGRPLAWTSRNPSIASVSPVGVVTGLAPGVAVIEVVSEGYGALATVTVLAATPLTGVTIAGPSSVYPADVPTFTASPVGGTTPFQYVWRVEGVTRQTGPNASFAWSSGASYTLSVSVTDGSGASRSATKTVQVQCGAICQP